MSNMGKLRSAELRKVATIMSIYHGNDPVQFREAIVSIFEQELPEGVESRLYLAVDGQIGEALDAEIAKHAINIYKLIRIEDNAGLPNALNQLIDNLEDEEFIFRMDGDDISFPDRYRKQIAFLDQSPKIDILGTSLFEMIEGDKESLEVSFCNGPEDALSKLGWRVPVGHPTVCFRRQVLKKTGGYPLIPGNEDIAMWFLCAQMGFRFDNLQEPLLYFRVSESFWKRRGFNKAFREWQIYIRGTYNLNGLSPVMLLSTARFILRLMPVWVSKLAYRSDVRRPQKDKSDC